ncbi:MAG: carboxypeptidase-like regulatory domain-containing protein [Candidatus Bathyarchaeota archaeon]|nr:carboxypeptidase-like regulatory domain-containing protein [Candidatus Bathyarchaeota archaeon]MDH5494852.1 carboxypeptidase-like regulatory domain-containing protein [Candidatus Bathyarchaeota archaeon]
MHKKLHIKRITTFSIILLILTFLTAWPIPKVSAEVSISGLSLNEGLVGDLVELDGQINTTDGAYEILFDGSLVESGNANLTTVEDTFVVPNSTKGDHVVALRDVEANITSDATTFTVKTGYIVKATKPRIQEDENATILAIITGGEANITLSANVTVMDPDNKTHSCPNFNITTEQNGYGETSKIYPTDFDAEPHTFYVGTYNLTLNAALNTTIGSFTVGLTDAAEYHRFQVVNTKAANYTLPTDIMKITITHNGETVFTSPTMNASETGGVIIANWTISANASIGLYIVNVINTTSIGTEKPVPDNQTFTIVSKSFACEVNAFNLDGEPVEGIVVEANNTFTSTISTNTTNKDGLASFYLEATNYIFTAFLNDSQVGATSETSLAGNLTGTLALNIKCSLAHIRVAVRDAEGKMLPFVSISANFTYTTRANITIARTASTETNLTGVATLRNLFININYTIKASRYGQTFNTTILDLVSTSGFNMTCPTLELIIKVFDRSSSLFRDALVKVYDWGIGLSGLVGEGNTNASGEVAFNFTFGKYIVKVYKDGVLLNETSMFLKDDPTSFAVYCKLYNLTLEVSVLDYFGQGISDANVTIEREGTILSSSTTRGNGVAQFTELIGGDYKIFVYIAEKPYKITTLYLQEPKTVTLKIEEIVSIGGFITETSHFITAVLILLVIIVFLLAFIYRRFKSRQKEE